MTLTAALVGGAVGTGCHVMNNAMRKIPLSRHPWGHVGGFLIGVAGGLYWEKTEYRMLLGVNEIRADKGLPPIVNTDKYFPKYHEDPEAALDHKPFTVPKEEPNFFAEQAKKMNFQQEIWKQQENMFDYLLQEQGINKDGAEAEEKKLLLKSIDNAGYLSSASKEIVKKMFSKDIQSEGMPSDASIDDLMTAQHELTVAFYSKLIHNSPKNAENYQTMIDESQKRLDDVIALSTPEEKKTYLKKVHEEDKEKMKKRVQKFDEKLEKLDLYFEDSSPKIKESAKSGLIQHVIQDLRERMKRFDAMSDEEKEKHLDSLLEKQKVFHSMSNEEKCRKNFPDWDMKSEAEQNDIRKKMKEFDEQMIKFTK